MDKVITHIIYHIYGCKVGCTNNLARRISEYRRMGFSSEEIDILEELYDKTDKEAGDIEWQWADRFGYKRGAHYTSLTREQRSVGFRKMSFGEHQEAGRKGAQRGFELGTGLYGLTSDQRSEAGRKGGKVGGKNGSRQDKVKAGLIGGRRAVELGRTGFQVMTFEKHSEIGLRTAELGKAGFQIKTVCIHCGFESNVANIRHWHNGNCKKRPMMRRN
jgi:hypothetical protein